MSGTHIVENTNISRTTASTPPIIMKSFQNLLKILQIALKN
ncbi:hypothetical protein [Helicobacter pylori]|nr:hypothetical protein [Helicobacter pylori]MDU9702564.1 hypothetical protein [Helicobacter pylori]